MRFFLFLFFSSIFIFGNNINAQGTDDYFIDARDSTSYKIVNIGNQIWMSENLKYKASSGSWCYDNCPEICEKYGKLYDWETANTVCPEGWRLPTKDDLETLLSNVEDDESDAYKAFKYGGSTGFSALLGGWYVGSNQFNNIEERGYWWSASEYDDSSVWFFGIRSGRQNVYLNYRSLKSWGFSVRCIKEE